MGGDGDGSQWYPLAMPTKRRAPKASQPVQTTSLGYELPVPMHKDVLAALRKAAKPLPPKDVPKEP
jgi:hypothetical protein